VARLDYLRTGTTYFGEDNLMYQPEYQTVDARLGLQWEKWEVALWGRNIFDEPYAVSAFSRGISPLIYGSLNVDLYTIAPGAMYGVEGRWRF
jgi:outer membrane receptor protein involved in Fe transport